MKLKIYKFKKLQTNMFKRIQVYFLVFLTTIQYTFAAFGGSGNPGKYSSGPSFLTGPLYSIFEILQDEKVVAAIIFIAMLITFFNIIKIALKPLFGDHTKERNSVALSISIIGNLGLAFILAPSPSLYVTLFGGSIGGVFLASIFIGLIVWLDKIVSKTHERFTSRIWWFWISLGVFIAATALLGYLLSFDSAPEVLISILSFLQSWGIIIAVIFGISFFLKKRYNRKDIIKENPDIKKSKESIDKFNIDIEKKIKAIDESFIKISKGL